MNNKILSAILLTGIAATGFAGLSSADNHSNSINGINKGNFERQELTDEQKAEREVMKAIFDKKRDGEDLTSEEETKLEEFKANHKGRKFEKKGPRPNLTDEEKTALESMSNEEKKEFFEAKKEEMKAKMEELKPLIEKKKAGEELTDEEQAKLDEFKANHKGGKGGKGGDCGEGHDKGGE